MLLDWRLGRHGWRFEKDEGGGGGGDDASASADAAAAEGDESSQGAEGQEEGTDGEATDESATEGEGEGEGEDEQEGEGDGEAEGEADGKDDGKGVKKEAPAKGATAKRLPETVPYKRFQEMNRQVRELQTQLAELTKKPEKDPYDDLLEKMPRGDEGTEQRALYDNIRDLAPIIKAIRPAILPQVREVMTVVGGLLRAVDKISFVYEQIASGMVETDADGNIVKDNRPLGLKHLDRISEIRDEVFQRSQGKTILRHADAFEELQQQLQDEEDQKSVKQQDEERIRADERARTERIAKQRKQASRSAGSGSVATVPKGKSQRPMSFEEMEASNARL